MLDPDVRFGGFDTDDWTRLLELMRPRTAGKADVGLVVVYESGRVLKALRTEGTPTLRHGARWPQPMPDVARQQQVQWIVAVRVGALETWADAVARGIRKRHDMLDQVLVAWDAARSVALERGLATWPTSVTSVPMPSRAVLMAALGLICPPHQTVVVASWDAGKVWTSLAMRRSSAGFDRMLGPGTWRGSVEASGPNADAMWRTLLRGVRRDVGPVALGIAATQATWSQVSSGEPGAWARAAATGSLTVDPLTRGFAVPLALGAGRMALTLVRSTFGRGGARGDLGDAGAAMNLAELWQVVEGLWRLQRAPRR